MRYLRILLPICGTFAILRGIFLLAGCAAGPNSKTAAAPPKENPEPYTDPSSGILIPARLDSLERISLNTGNTGGNPIGAHYIADDQIHSPDDPLPLMQSHLAFFLNADLRVIPSSRATPGQIIAQAINAAANFPNFALTAYDGARRFGNQSATCAQFTFDRPAWTDQITAKMIIIPRGGYLACFCFLIGTPMDRKWQGTIDGFIRDILAKSANQSLAANASGAPNDALISIRPFWLESIGSSNSIYLSPQSAADISASHSAFP